MSLTIEYVPKPGMIEYTVFADVGEFMNLIKDKGYVFIDITDRTKTRLSTSVYIPGYRYLANEKYNNGLKYFTSSEYSYATYEQVESHFLVIGKKFNQSHLEIHLRSLFDKIFSKYMDKITFKVYNSRIINEIRLRTINQMTI